MRQITAGEFWNWSFRGDSFAVEMGDGQIQLAKELMTGAFVPEGVTYELVENGDLWPHARLKAESPLPFNLVVKADRTENPGRLDRFTDLVLPGVKELIARLNSTEVVVAQPVEVFIANPGHEPSSLLLGKEDAITKGVHIELVDNGRIIHAQLAAAANALVMGAMTCIPEGVYVSIHQNWNNLERCVASIWQNDQLPEDKKTAVQITIGGKPVMAMSVHRALQSDHVQIVLEQDTVFSIGENENVGFRGRFNSIEADYNGRIRSGVLAGNNAVPLKVGGENLFFRSGTLVEFDEAGHITTEANHRPRRFGGKE